MRAMLLVFILILCAAAGLSGLWFLSRAESQAVQRAHEVTPAEPGKANGGLATAADVDRLEEQVRAMRNEIARLSAELGSMRESAQRREVAPEDVAAPVPGAVEIHPDQRAAVLQILQEDREARELERAEQRKEREQKALNARASRIAQELGLGPVDETRLAQLLVQESEKRSQLFERVRDEGWDRELVRAGMQELREWREAEYDSAFGSDLAAQIRELGGTQRFERPVGRFFDGGLDPDRRRGGNRRDN